MTRSWKLACSGLIFCCYDGVIVVTIKAKKHGALHKQHWTRYEERKEENRGRISVPINAKLTDGDNDYKRLSLFGFYILWKFKSYFFRFLFLSQAKEGPCNTSRPGFWDMIGKAKW